MTEQENNPFIQNLILEIENLHHAIQVNNASIAARQVGFIDTSHQGDTKYIQTLIDLCNYEIENLKYTTNVINSIIEKYAATEDETRIPPELPYFLVTKLYWLLSKSVCISLVFNKFFAQLDIDVIQTSQDLDNKNISATTDSESTKSNIKETLKTYDINVKKYYEYITKIKALIETFDHYKISTTQQTELINIYSSIKISSTALITNLESKDIQYVIKHIKDKDLLLQDIIESLKKIREDIATNNTKIVTIEKDVTNIKKLLKVLDNLGGGSGGGFWNFLSGLISTGVSVAAIVAGLYIAKKALAVALTAVSVATKASYAAASASYYAKKARDFAEDAVAQAKEALRIIKEYKKLIDNHENRIRILENKINDIDALGDRTDNLENKINDLTTKLSELSGEFNVFKTRYISWDYITDKNYKVPPLCNTEKDYIQDISFGSKVQEYANQSELIATEMKQTKIEIEEILQYKENLLTYLKTNKSNVCEVTLKVLKDTILDTIKTSPDLSSMDIKSLISKNVRKIAIDEWVYINNPSESDITILKDLRTLWWNMWEKKQISIINKTKDTKHDYYVIKLAIVENKTDTIIKYTDTYEKQTSLQEYLPKLTSTQTIDIHIEPVDIDYTKTEDTHTSTDEVTEKVVIIPNYAFTIPNIHQFILNIKNIKLQDIKDFTYTKPLYLNLETCNTEDILKLDKNKKKFLQILDYPFIINFIFNYEQILGLEKLKTDYKNIEELLQSEQDAQNKIEQDAQKNIKLLKETNTTKKI